MKELNFQPTKSGFMAWVCKVKMPGKPNKYYEVRAWTQRGAIRKANKAHADLLASYIYQSGISKQGNAIVEEIPPLPPDSPKWVDTDRPRRISSENKALKDSSITAKVTDDEYVDHEGYSVAKGNYKVSCEKCESDDWVAFPDSRGDIVVGCLDCGKVRTSIKAL
jgi:hypothetical protein